MLTVAENERLTRVGPGTPMGELMRRYWHPIAPVAALYENPVRKVTILGEELVLYRDRSGQLGLIGPQCAHRLVHLQFGMPDEHGLRCPYHGWCYNEAGHCTDTPLEPLQSRLKDHVKIAGYPVQEMGGLVFAYLGAAPAPILPPWDFLVWPNSIRQIAVSVIPCNWLQCHENSADPLHGVYLHGHFFKYQLERMGQLEERSGDSGLHPVYAMPRLATGADGIVYEEHPNGFRKGVRYAMGKGAAEDRVKWSLLNLFPCYSRGVFGVRTQVNMRIPMDDNHTYHLNYTMYHTPDAEAPPQDVVPYFDAPLYDENGEPILDYVLAQDMAAWRSQGPITDRTQEHLAGTDLAIIEFRNLIKRQLELVEAGKDPINVFRDPAEVGECIELKPKITSWDKGEASKVATYRSQYHEGFYRDDVDRYGPLTGVAQDLMKKTAEQQSTKTGKPV